MFQYRCKLLNYHSAIAVAAVLLITFVAVFGVVAVAGCRCCCCHFVAAVADVAAVAVVAGAAVVVVAMVCCCLCMFQ